MVLLIFLPFLIIKTSALCLPDFPSSNQNEDFYNSLYYGNPAALQNEAFSQGHFPQIPEFFGEYYSINPYNTQGASGMGILRKSMQDFNQGGMANYDGYSGYMPGEPPGSGWEYNKDQKRGSENYKQEKLSAIKEHPSINGGFKGSQQRNAHPQGGSLSCKPYAGLYANNFDGGDYSNLYNQAVPYIYNRKYLDNLRALTGYNFLKNMDFPETQMDNLDLERMRIIFGNKWDQIQDFYSLRYLTFLENLYQPHFLTNVNIDDQYYKLAMLQDKTMHPFFRPEYNLNDINQHVFYYLDYLRSIHPELFPQYQPYQYLQWGAYPGTTGHQQIPINNQLPPPYFSDRSKNNPKNEVKVTDTVKAETTKVGDENGNRVLENKEENLKITEKIDDKHDGDKLAWNKEHSEYETKNKNNEYAGEKFDKIQVETGNKYQSIKDDVSTSVEGGHQFSETANRGGGFSAAGGSAGNLGQFGGEYGNKYQSAGVESGQHFSGEGHMEGGFSSTSGSAGNLGKELGQFGGGSRNKYQSASLGAEHIEGEFTSTSGSAGNIGKEAGQFGEEAEIKEIASVGGGQQFSGAGAIGKGSSTRGRLPPRFSQFGEGAMNDGLNKNGSTENQFSYTNEGLVETIEKDITEPRKISLTIEIPSQTIETKSGIIPIKTETVSKKIVEGEGRVQGSNLVYGGSNQGVENVNGYKIQKNVESHHRGSKHGVGGDFGKSTITKVSHRGGSKRGRFGSRQAGKFGFIRSSKGNQAHGHSDNWHKGRSSVLHTFFLPLLTDGKSGENSEDDDDEDEDVNYETTVVVKDGSSNGGVFSTGGDMKQEANSEFFSTSGGFNQGRGQNGGYKFISGGGSQNKGGFTTGGGGFDQMYPSVGGGRLERVYTTGGNLNLGGGGFRGTHTSEDGNYGQMFTTGGGINLKGEGAAGGRGDFSTGGRFGMIGGGVGERREEAPFSFGSGSKREGVFLAGGGNSGLTFSTGGDLEKGGYSFSSGGLGKSSLIGEGKAFSGETTKELSGASTNLPFASRFNDETEESKTAEAKAKTDAAASTTLGKEAEKAVSESVDKRPDTVTESIKNAEAVKA